MHVVCQNELRGEWNSARGKVSTSSSAFFQADTPREELDNGSIHTTCPFCHTSADMIRLGVEEVSDEMYINANDHCLKPLLTLLYQLPERVQQYFQPMQTSFMDLIKAYEVCLL